MIIDYNGVKTFTDSLQIDDIGNCAIKCEGVYREGRIQLYGEYYLVTKTIAGRTSIAKFGPIVPDLNVMQNSFECTYKNIAYKESTIIREINLFINDGMKGISKAEVITDLEVFEAFPSLQETFDNM